MIWHRTTHVCAFTAGTDRHMRRFIAWVDRTAPQLTTIAKVQNTVMVGSSVLSVRRVRQRNIKDDRLSQRRVQISLFGCHTWHHITLAWSTATPSLVVSKESAVVLTSVVAVEDTLWAGVLLFIAVENLTHLVQLIFADFTLSTALRCRCLRCSSVHRVSLELRTGRWAFSVMTAGTTWATYCSCSRPHLLFLDLFRLVSCRFWVTLAWNAFINGWNTIKQNFLIFLNFLIALNAAHACTADLRRTVSSPLDMSWIECWVYLGQLSGQLCNGDVCDTVEAWLNEWARQDPICILRRVVTTWRNHQVIVLELALFLNSTFCMGLILNFLELGARWPLHLRLVGMSLAVGTGLGDGGSFLFYFWGRVCFLEWHLNSVGQGWALLGGFAAPRHLHLAGAQGRLLARGVRSHVAADFVKQTEAVVPSEGGLRVLGGREFGWDIRLLLEIGRWRLERGQITSLFHLISKIKNLDNVH